MQNVCVHRVRPVGAMKGARAVDSSDHVHMDITRGNRGRGPYGWVCSKLDKLKLKTIIVFEKKLLSVVRVILEMGSLFHKKVV